MRTRSFRTVSASAELHRCRRNVTRNSVKLKQSHRSKPIKCFYSVGRMRTDSHYNSADHTLTDITLPDHAPVWSTSIAYFAILFTSLRSSSFNYIVVQTDYCSGDCIRLYFFVQKNKKERNRPEPFLTFLQRTIFQSIFVGELDIKSAKKRTFSVQFSGKLCLPRVIRFASCGFTMAFVVLLVCH